MDRRENIKRLLAEYMELEQSAENKRRRAMWDYLPKGGRDQFRPVPKFDYSWKDGCIPITADIQNPTWSEMFGFSLEDYYTNAEVFLESHLKIMLYRFKNFADDTFLTKWIPIWGSCALEGSVFGMEYGFYHDKDPWLSHKPVIETSDDIKRFRDNPPDFKTVGIVPNFIKMYEECKEMLPDDYEVLFPHWCRSIFGVATYVRGYEDFLCDMLVDPDFANDLLRLITDVRRDYVEAMEKYTGEPRSLAFLYNDEINCPSISPQNYRDMVFPYEKEICDFHGGAHYWHSCGDVTMLVPEIAKLPNLKLFNRGAWTDVYEAGVAFKDKCPLEICMNPQKHILEGTKESMTALLNGMIEDCRRSDINGFYFKISALNRQSTTEHAVGQIKLWVETAKEVISKV
ncbi:MAG: uroporphyrinogen decarboxylase family protein [Eubacteriales bacterium]